MTGSRADVVIVGAGHAGGTAAAALRQHGHTGAITLVGAEDLLPYQRPPLSKAWLKGEVDAAGLVLRPDAFYAERGVETRLNHRALRIDRSARLVHTDRGGPLPYDKLILAMGARPRTLSVPGSDLSGVTPLRSVADAQRLKAVLASGARLAVIGGGYIGLETAAAARALGAEVVVIEAMSRVLARVADERLSAFIEDYHRARGVRFELEAVVAALTGVAGRVTGVALADGRVIDADVVLVGVGAVPNIELAQEAGLDCADGVEVDERSRTSDPDILAIGDLTRRPVPPYAGSFRLESVANAVEQARQAAACIVGAPASAAEVPWNWSDQYDLKLQLAGLRVDADTVVLRGEPASGSFALFHLRGDVIRAVEAVNAPAEFIAGRKLIARGQAIDAARLHDAATSMKELASQRVPATTGEGR